MHIASVEVVIGSHVIVLDSLLVFIKRLFHTALVIESKSQVFVVEGKVFSAAIFVSFYCLLLKLYSFVVGRKRSFKFFSFELGQT